MRFFVVRPFRPGGFRLSLAHAKLGRRLLPKEAFAAKIIADGQIWIDMLNHRNLLSHTYDFAVFEEAIRAAAEHYIPALQELHEFLSKELQK